MLSRRDGEEELPGRQPALQPVELSSQIKKLVPWTAPEHPSTKWFRPALTLTHQNIHNDFCIYQNSQRKRTACWGPNILTITFGVWEEAAFEGRGGFPVTKLCPLFATLWTIRCQTSLSFTVSWSLLKFMCIESVMLSKHPILCHLLPFLTSVFLIIRAFSNELPLPIRWPKY